MSKAVIVRYGELALKSWPVRRRFERRLISAIKLVLKGYEYSLRTERGRIFVDTKSPGRVVRRLSMIPGVVSVSAATRVPAKIEEISVAAVEIAKKILSRGMSFAVRTSRAGKHDFTSMDVNVRAGSEILSAIEGVRVDLRSPDRQIFVEIRENDAYLFTETVDGVGGLPLGTQGRVAAVFSGTRNDLLAAYLMMKRGAIVFPIYPNFTSSGLSRTLITSARRLAALDPELELRMIPFKKVLDSVRKVPARGYACWICKRSVLKAVDAVAEQVKADAVVVGDDGTQISSQKLINLTALDESCDRPVLRPLVGLGESEIEKLNIKIRLPRGKKEPCPPSSPEGFVDLDRIHELEKRMKIDELIRRSVSRMKVVRVIQ
ncbi:MAG TPA: tRNA sulfurtransferase [Hadesarchaea archaeon]|nr:tRNA sulfurtransferase [Hadesarchaea archaeon]